MAHLKNKFLHFLYIAGKIPQLFCAALYLVYIFVCIIHMLKFSSVRKYIVGLKYTHTEISNNFLFSYKHVYYLHIFVHAT